MPMLIYGGLWRWDDYRGISGRQRQPERLGSKIKKLPARLLNYSSAHADAYRSPGTWHAEADRQGRIIGQWADLWREEGCRACPI